MIRRRRLLEVAHLLLAGEKGARRADIPRHEDGDRELKLIEKPLHHRWLAGRRT